MTAPLAVRFSPYISAYSGRPFNITTGRDFYGDSMYTDRPSLAVAGQPGAIVTPYGVFNPNPAPNDPRIPRNYANGPGSFSVNLRMSRTWGFGPTRGVMRADCRSERRRWRWSGGDHGAAPAVAAVQGSGGGPRRSQRRRHAHGR